MAVGIVVLAMLVAACAGPTANVMAMRDIPREQQDRDRADCVVGWKSGVDRAHDEYLSAYTACMRQRGYTVIRERR